MGVYLVCNTHQQYKQNAKDKMFRWQQGPWPPLRSSALKQHWPESHQKTGYSQKSSLNTISVSFSALLNCSIGWNFQITSGFWFLDFGHVAKVPESLRLYPASRLYKFLRSSGFVQMQQRWDTESLWMELEGLPVRTGQPVCLVIFWTV